MQRYFIDDQSIVDLAKQTIIIKGDDVHHIIDVMRMQPGDEIIACYQEEAYLAKIITLDKASIQTTIIDKINKHVNLPYKVTIAQGLVRREKMEEVIDHITELGAAFYLPVIMARSNVKINDEKKDKKLTRLNKIAKEAAEQAHRNTKLEVLDVVSFNNFLRLSHNYDLCIVAHVDDNNEFYLSDVIKSQKNIMVLVGPEGGISDNELNLLKAANFIQVRLSKTVLRTEVAPSYIMSIINHLAEVNHE